MNKIFGKVVGGDSTNHTITIQCDPQYPSMVSGIQIGSNAEVIINPTYQETYTDDMNINYYKTSNTHDITDDQFDMFLDGLKQQGWEKQ